MSSPALTILRIGLGITFVWLGYQIWLEPLAWGSFMLPWAQELLPRPLEEFMKMTAIIDIVIGIWFIVGWKIWIPALLASAHLFGVLITTTGSLQLAISRDVGLLAGTLAILADTLPASIKRRFIK